MNALRQNAVVWWLEWLVEAMEERLGSFDGWQTAVSKPNRIKADARVEERRRQCSRGETFQGFQTAVWKPNKIEADFWIAQRGRWPGSLSSAKGPE